MPLIGDAVIGLTALLVVLLVWTARSPLSWLIAVVWSAIGAFDALAAWVVEVSAPWPEFFMLETFGRSMFFAAASMHLFIIYMLSRPDILAEFGLAEARKSHT